VKQSARNRDKYAIKAAETCGFFAPCICKNKAAIDAHIKAWLPNLHHSSFIVYMATLQSILGRTSFPHNNVTVLTKHFKLAKSALLNGRFPPAATEYLTNVIKDLVKQVEKKGNSGAQSAQEA
jgi:hypothetical protein